MNEERVLVGRLRNGDQSAFRELVEQYKKQVYYLALNMTGDHFDAEDVSQDVFVKAYRGIGKFRSSAKLSTWLHRITVNTVIDSRRRKTHTMVSMSDDRDDEGMAAPLQIPALDAASNPESAAAGAVINGHIGEALNALSDQERTVFVMRHYQDMPIKEISEVLEVADGTVKSLLFRSIRKLREKLSFYRDELGLEDSV